jgi:peptide/nickel transport system permease protein
MVHSSSGKQSRRINFIRVISFAILSCLFLSAPVFVERSGDRLSLNLDAPRDVATNLIESIRSGEAFSYTAGTMRRSVIEEAPRYVKYSFLMVFCSSLLSLAIALFVVLPSRSIIARSADGFSKAFNIVPIFALALLAQTAVVYITQVTGVRIALIGFRGIRSLSLPILVLAASATSFLIDMLRSASDELGESDFIRFARAKGLKPSSVTIRHLYPGLENRLKAHLHGFLAFQFTGLFVIERIFSIPGLTRLVFDYAFQHIVRDGEYVRTYQVDMVILGFLLLFTIYVVTYVMLRFLLWSLRVTFLAIRVRGEHPVRQSFMRLKVTANGRINIPYKVPLIIGGSILAFFVLLAVLGPSIAPYAFEAHETFVRVPGPNGTEELYVSPVPPLPSHPFGTDQTGRDLLTLMLYGLRYTLFAAISIVFVSVGCSAAVAALIFRRNQRMGSGLIFFSAIPVFMIAYFMLESITIDSPIEPVALTIVQGSILSLLSVPRLIPFIHSRFRQIAALPYVEAARAYGADESWIVLRHLLPACGGELALLCAQELARILGLFGFLALFNIYIGGTGVTIYPTLHFPIVYDWAGLVGRHIDSIYNSRWLLAYPLTGYILLLAGASIFARGISKSLSRTTTG